MKNERAYFEQGHLVIIGNPTPPHGNTPTASCSCGELCYFLLRVTNEDDE